MFNRLKKYKEKKRLTGFLHVLESPAMIKILPEDYIDSHSIEIDMIKWLIAYYENKASEPILYLEALINLSTETYKNYAEEMERFNIVPLSETITHKHTLRQIKFLYNWIQYKKITSF